ncbi:MAG: response regulator [Gammaproteobacteria bacterium]|nr:response regulator [Gammaproteobacteria bacterium]
MNILVIEDDQAIRDMICLSLSQANYYTSGCVDVKCAKKYILEIKPDCLIVDWMLPDSSGIELIRWLRRQENFKQIPALMLTAKSEESDKITGLDSGADDYMTKPLSLRELHSRIKALLRRPLSYTNNVHLIQSGPITMNTDNHDVLINNNPVDLTKTEYLLLKFFISNENKVFSRDQILNSVWGVNAYLGDRTVDVHILRLRKILKQFKLEKMVKTVRGSGYRFSSKKTT